MGNLGIPKLACAVMSDVTFGYVIIGIKMCVWDLIIRLTFIIREVLHLSMKII